MIFDYRVGGLVDFESQTRIACNIIDIKRKSVDIGRGWNIITKNKTECSIGKYFHHLVEPDITKDISPNGIFKGKKLEKVKGKQKSTLVHSHRL